MPETVWAGCGASLRYGESPDIMEKKDIYKYPYGAGYIYINIHLTHYAY